MDKRQLRQRIKALKAQLGEAQRLEEAERVFARLESLAEFVNARNILVFSSLPDELPTEKFIEKWCDKKCLYLPRVNGDDLDILRYDRAALHQGAFNIQEPDGEPEDPAVLDLIIVPGVGFDPDCNRLGRGRGYYDRLLSQVSVPTIGVCFDCQLVPHISVEQHDIPLSAVITPSTIHRHL